MNGVSLKNQELGSVLQSLAQLGRKHDFTLRDRECIIEVKKAFAKAFDDYRGVHNQMVGYYAEEGEDRVSPESDDYEEYQRRKKELEEKEVVVEVEPLDYHAITAGREGDIWGDYLDLLVLLGVIVKREKSPTGEDAEESNTPEEVEA